VESLVRKDTRDGKPFWELVLADAEGKLTLRAWSDSPAFPHCERLQPGDFLEICGEFASNPGFGIDAKRWTCRALTTEERDALLAGPPELQARQGADYAYIVEEIARVKDPRLRGLAELFLKEYGDRFRRTAAARYHHHARRGGLVEHVAQMLRTAVAVAGAYPRLNRDLLVVGVLFHDSGKLWENAMPADGFSMPYYEMGEMLGHITTGIELVNNFWRRLHASPEAAEWNQLQPPSDDVRMHLLHLLVSHHGELEWGSPVVPKTPEAWALHYVDNLDAKLEMVAGAYATSKNIAPRIYERVRPLAGHLIVPLPRFSPQSNGSAAADDFPSA
jgi:3'-5' exoribonuclease